MRLRKRIESIERRPGLLFVLLLSSQIKSKSQNFFFSR